MLISLQQLNARSRRFKFATLLLIAAASYVFANPVCAKQQPDAGAWTRQTSGTFAWLHAVYFLDANRGWAVGGAGAVFATTDGGRTWQAKPRPNDDNLRDVYFSDERTGWIVCERSIFKLKTVDETRSFLMKTTDGGVTWTRVEATKPDVNVRLVRIYFADRERGWTFGEAGALYATTDAGASWMKQTVPTRHLLLGASFVSPQQGWIVGAGASVITTTDGGGMWRGVSISANTNIQTQRASAISQAASSPLSRPRLNAVSFVDDKRGWAVGAAGVIMTTANGGRTWRSQNSNTDVDLLDVKFINAAEGWAVGGEGTIIHTTNGGASWRTEPSGTMHTLERLCIAQPKSLWAVGFGGTIIRYTPDQSNVNPPKLRTGGTSNPARTSSGN